MTPDTKYIFKHALVQEAAYQSVPRAKRKELHRRIAQALEEHFPQLVENMPELVAYHLTEAGRIEQSIPYWYRAGQRAAERSADLEAVEHLKKGIRLVGGLPVSPQRMEQELDLLIALGPALMNTKGTASAEVENAYLRARELCGRVGQPAQHFAVVWGLWLNHYVGESLRSAQLLADEVMDLAEQVPGSDCALQAHHANWSTLSLLGNLSTALHHAEQGWELYDLEEHRSHAFIYGGHDPGVCAASDVAVLLWLLGYPDQAAARMQEGLALAEQLEHPFSLAQAYGYVGILYQLMREPHATLDWSEKLLRYCYEHDLELWGANGRILKGWALADLGKATEGLELFRGGVEQRDAAGVQLRQSLYLAALAQALQKAGQADQAKQALTRAFDLVARTGEHIWLAYLHWAAGQVLLSGSASGDCTPKTCLESSLRVAQDQSARSLELRAATSLARIWRDQGKPAKGLEILAPVYDWFTEGFDTADLKEAKALLDELR